MTKVKAEIYWIPSSLRKPEPYKQVLIAGGVAIWNGTNWFINEGHRVIQWPVTWWAEFPDSPTE